MVDSKDFHASLKATKPPERLNRVQQALWWAGRRDWARAHEIVQKAEGMRDCDRVHAFLHRREGDLSNARYWYRQADARMPDVSIQEEWTELVRLYVR